MRPVLPDSLRGSTAIKSGGKVIWDWYLCSSNAFLFMLSLSLGHLLAIKPLTCLTTQEVALKLCRDEMGKMLLQSQENDGTISCLFPQWRKAAVPGQLKNVMDLSVRVFISLTELWCDGGCRPYHPAVFRTVLHTHVKGSSI